MEWKNQKGIKNPSVWTATTKRCPLCKIFKPFNEFHKNKHQSGGLYSLCIFCHRLTRYKLTPETYNKIWDKQGKCCALCQTTTPDGVHKQWCIDHDHETGLVRGILCDTCNQVLGRIKDNFLLAYRISEYLGKFHCLGAINGRELSNTASA